MNNIIEESAATATEYIQVVPLDDLPLNRAKQFEVAGIAIILCRVGDAVFALDAICSHALKPLNGGRVRGGALMCPHHGAKFDLATGAQSAPAVRSIGVHPVRVRNDMVEVAIAGKAAA
ncbi:MAG: Rieske 2Fe-2S domain-containing protein [Pseudomonadota bacterium]